MVKNLISKGPQKFCATSKGWGCALVWSRRTLLLNKLGCVRFTTDWIIFRVSQYLSTFITTLPHKICLVSQKTVAIIFPMECATVAFYQSTLTCSFPGHDVMKQIRGSTSFSRNMYSNLCNVAILFNLCSWDNKQNIHWTQTFWNPSSALTVLPINVWLVWKLAGNWCQVHIVSLVASIRSGISVDVEGLPLCSSPSIFLLPVKNNVCHWCTIWILLQSGLYTETKWQWMSATCIFL